MIPYSYTIRNLIKHRMTTLLTIGGLALVIFSIAAIFMLADGLRQTLVSTGSPDNVIVIRKAAQTEVTSIVMRDQADIIETLPEIAIGTDGRPEYTNEVYVLISLQKRSGEGTSNIVVRGVTAKSLSMRSNIKITEGRIYNPGTAEIIAGKAVSGRFKGCKVGETIRFNARDWKIVGLFDAQGSAFDSEVWGDVDQVMDAFRRPVYSSLTFRLSDPAQLAAVRSRIEGDPRLPLEAKQEREYYDEQSKATTVFVVVMGVIVCVFFGLGATIGAAITMYASVANRTKEIGTLRALGFRRRSILRVFLAEAVTISMIAGLLGIAAAYFLRFKQISTVNFSTFSEVAFSFELTGMTIVICLAVSLLMGFLGGFLPAVRASRLKIVESLRAN